MARCIHREGRTGRSRATRSWTVSRAPRVNENGSADASRHQLRRALGDVAASVNGRAHLAAAMTRSASPSSLAAASLLGVATGMRSLLPLALLSLTQGGHRGVRALLLPLAAAE